MRQCRESPLDRPKPHRNSVNDKYYDYSQTLPGPPTLCLLKGVGNRGGQEQEQGSAKGSGPLWTLPLGVPSVPKAPKPWGPMSLMTVHAWSPVPLGVPSGSSGGTGFRAGSLVGWACPGELGPYFPLLARPVLFCTGLGPSRAAREPSGGAPPRFILRLALRAASWPEPPSGEARGSARRAGRWALGALRGTFAPAPWLTKGVLCPVRTGLHSRELGAGPEVGVGVSRWRDQLGQRHRGRRGPGMTGWWFSVPGHQGMLGRNGGLDESRCQQGVTEGP